MNRKAKKHIPPAPDIEKEEPPLQKEWDVHHSSKAEKQREKLPQSIQEIFDTLTGEMEKLGPIRDKWPDFGPLHPHKKKIPKNSYHCHLKNGRPTYVACWSFEHKKIKATKNKKNKIIKEIKIIEVYYVGTHEDSPYQKH